MIKLIRTSLSIAFFATLISPASFAAKVGAPAPDFSAKDIDGKTVKLSGYQGKYVVLEWHNQGCPYVKKHYNSSNMQKLQAKWTQKGVIWLSIISSAKGKEGYVTADEEKTYLKEKSASPTDVLLDSDGIAGKLYSAKTTPHMFVIDPKGTLIYDGAIDDKPSTDVKDVEGAKNYVSAALDEAMAGKPVTTSSTRPYGCSVKYKD